ncbi:hypothetical protein GEMRC1_009438 [Eukaryota sp. GEM-RC1]
MLFACLTLYSIFTKPKHFTFIKCFIVAGALFSFFAYFVWYFMFPDVPIMHTGISVVSLLVVAAGVVLKVRRIVVTYNSDDYVMACASLYLDFMKLFVKVAKLLVKMKMKEDKDKKKK